MNYLITLYFVMLLAVIRAQSQDQLTNDGNIQLHSGATLAVYGNFIDNGTFTPGTGMVSFCGSSTQSIGGTATTSFFNVEVDKTDTAVLAKILTISNNFTITNGAFNVHINNYQLNVGGNFTNNGTFNAQLGKVVFNGTTTQQIAGTSTTTFNYIDLTNTATTGLQIETNTNLKNSLTLIANTTMDADGTGGLNLFTLLSTNDDPTSDAGIAALPTTANITGKVQVQRYMTAEGKLWRYIGSPVDGATVADWQLSFPITGSFTGADVLGGGNNPSLYKYDETQLGATSNGWTAYPVTTNTETLTPGIGFATFIREIVNPTTIEISGTITDGVNRGNVSLGLSYTVSSPPNPSADGWNLVANPYPAAIDWNLLYDDVSRANVDGVMYVTDNGSGTTLYKGYDAANDLPVNGGSQYVASGQAFWVKSSAAAPALTVKESMKTTNSNIFYRTTGPNNFLRIKMVQGSLSDETLLFFYPDAVPGKDKYDSYKLNNGIFNFCSLMDDGSHMVTNAWGPLSCSAMIKLSLQNADPGMYSLLFSSFDSFQEPVQAYLEDAYLNNSFLLSEGFNYDFDVTADTASFGDHRFNIAFKVQEIDTVISISAPPIACNGHSIVITLDTTQVGVQYQAFFNDLPVSEMVDGTSMAGQMLVNTSVFNTVSNTVTVLASLTGCTIKESIGTIDITGYSPEEILTVNGDTVCTGGTAVLMVSGKSSTSKYRWYSNSIPSDPDQSTLLLESDSGIFVLPDLLKTTSVSVSIITQGGCESVSLIKVTAVVIPTYGIASVVNGVGCENTQIMLEANGAPVTGKYRWYTSMTDTILLAETTEGRFTTPILTQSLSYAVAAVNSLGCDGPRQEVFADVSPQTDLLIGLSAQDTICDSQDLLISLYSSQQGIQYFSMANNNVMSDTVDGTGASIQLVIPAIRLDTGAVNMQVFTKNDGCGQYLFLDQSITSFVSETRTVSSVVSDTLCSEGIAIIQATGAGSLDRYYLYDKVDDAEPTEINDTGIFNTPYLFSSRTFYVSLINGSGCEGEKTGVSATVIKLDKPLITVDTIAELTYRLSSDYPGNNQWYVNGEVIAGDTTASIIVIEPGIYIVAATMQGCTIHSDSVNLLYIITGLEDNSVRRAPQVFPNPVDRIIIIHIDQTQVKSAGAILYSMDGYMVKEFVLEEINHGDVIIDVTPFKPGQYVLRLVVNNAVYTYKLVKL